MNLKKVLDEIILEGGVSYNLNTGKANPSDGYMVSILGFEEQFNVNKVSNQTIKAFMLKNMDNLWGETRYLGGWLNNDIVYLDVSVHLQDLERAIYTGIINNQKCIYDCNNERNIYLPSPQTAGTEAQKSEYAKQAARQLVSNQLN
jgi:hypothetical protein